MKLPVTKFKVPLHDKIVLEAKSVIGNEKNIPNSPVNSSRRIWKKISLILVFSILLFTLAYSYLYPGAEKSTGYNTDKC